MDNRWRVSHCYSFDGAFNNVSGRPVLRVLVPTLHHELLHVCHLRRYLHGGPKRWVCPMLYFLQDLWGKQRREYRALGGEVYVCVCVCAWQHLQYGVCFSVNYGLINRLIGNFYKPSPPSAVISYGSTINGCSYFCMGGWLKGLNGLQIRLNISVKRDIQLQPVEICAVSVM